MSDHTGGEFKPVLPLVTDNLDFVLGVEVGMRYVELRDTQEREIEFTIHTQNEEQMYLMGQRMGWYVDINTLDDHWMNVLFTRK